MASEREFEDAIAKYPDLIESGLQLVGRQVVVYGRRMDLLFRDQNGRKLIAELKWGPIKDEHVGQIMAYEGCLLSSSQPDVRVMLVGTRVPPNLRASLDHHGIAWKEISPQQLVNHLHWKCDTELARQFESAATPAMLDRHLLTERRQTVPAAPSAAVEHRASRDAASKVRRTLSQLIGSCENKAIVDCIERALNRGQKTTGVGLRFDDANGQVRWYLNPQVTNAKVIQRGRFDGDEQFWRSILSDPDSVTPKRVTDGEADLRFHLWTADDCNSFTHVASTEAPQ